LPLNPYSDSDFLHYPADSTAEIFFMLSLQLIQVVFILMTPHSLADSVGNIYFHPPTPLLLASD
jgi:hypothetical protein